jgi:large subunit ribosomal protein L19
MSDHLLKTVEKEFFKTEELPEFRPGDTLRIHERVREGGREGRERIQLFEGVVLKKSGSGANAMFTVRKLSSGIGVEKVYPLHSPKIAQIEVVNKGRVRQARPNYLRLRQR